jgi:hypothetical protein
VNKDETTHTYEVEDATRSMCHLRTVDEDAEGRGRSPTETEDDAYADDEHEAEDADERASTATLPTLLPSPTTAMNAVKAATETSWRGDGRVARWLAERERKANKRALGPLRRARKELEWIVKRRSAQIANYRRDRKIEIEEQREAMAQAKVASYGVAAKDRKDATSKSENKRSPNRRRGGNHRAIQGHLPAAPARQRPGYKVQLPFKRRRATNHARRPEEEDIRRAALGHGAERRGYEE